MTEQLRLEYVPVDEMATWEDNPKEHNLKKLAESFRKHGFKDPAKWEPHLNDGAGGIAEGNGRAAVLKLMKEQGYDRPRGILETEDGRWTMPILFGVDADSEEAAAAYAVDHNNLVLAGTDAAHNMSKLWEPDSYMNLLERLGETGLLPVSVDSDELEQTIADALDPIADAVDHIDVSPTYRPSVEVAPDDVWKLGDHTLICVELDDWAKWLPLIGDGISIRLYPGPMAAIATEDPTLFIQPNTLICAHIVEQYGNVNEDKVERQ